MAASGSLHLRRREREELQQENGHARGRVCSGSKEEDRAGWGSVTAAIEMAKQSDDSGAGGWM